jgi:hypothetical protein
MTTDEAAVVLARHVLEQFDREGCTAHDMVPELRDAVVMILGARVLDTNSDWYTP